MKLTFAGRNWAELTVLPTFHPRASIMVLNPAGWMALKMHFKTELLCSKVQVGAVVDWPVIVAVVKVVK